AIFSERPCYPGSTESEARRSLPLRGGRGPRDGSAQLRCRSARPVARPDFRCSRPRRDLGRCECGPAFFSLALAGCASLQPQTTSGSSAAMVWFDKAQKVGPERLALKGKGKTGEISIGTLIDSEKMDHSLS